MRLGPCLKCELIWCRFSDMLDHEPSGPLRSPCERNGQDTEFYEAIFGWQIQDLGPQMGNYRMVTTGKDEAGKAWPGINGGMNRARDRHRRASNQ